MRKLAFILVGTFMIQITCLAQQVSVTATASDISEGGSVDFVFTRTGSTANALPVPFTIPEASQIAGFVDAPDLARRQITILAGQSSFAAHVSAIDDQLNTGDHVLTVQLGASQGGGSAHVTIHDNEPPPVFADTSWPEVFNPWKVLRIDLTMDAAKWTQMQNDTSETHFDATFVDGSTSYAVKTWAKSDGSPRKTIRVDLNAVDSTRMWRGLQKLNLHSGEGNLIKEGVSWYLHNLAGGFHNYDPTKAAFVKLYVNGTLAGVYLNLEKFDDRFAKNRNINRQNSTWLYQSNPGSGESFRIYPADLNLPDSPTFARIGGGGLQSDANWDIYFDLDAMLTLVAVDILLRNGDEVVTDNNVNRVDSYFSAHRFPADAVAPQLRFPLAGKKSFYVPRDLDSSIVDPSW